ncbi:Antho-RFamide neuropeptides type 2 [Amphibalanus amphitrite]|uniref:Antho-RFamide neuropeptides type 2 n=1 Tax=Amphibalanus amphitrite TaxID=1232801 RepID=A0A6A4WQ34_AMPAM|nr:Antho-RFamide neuropeptides type 2 [Amphibalanus amphitrite]
MQIIHGLNTDQENSGQTDQENSGQTDQEDSGQTDQEDSGQTDQEDSGQTDQEDSGQTDQEDSGQTDQEDSGQTGQEKSGQTDQADSGQTDQADSGQTDQDSGQTDQADSGQTDQADSGQTDQEDSGQTDQEDSGREDQPSGAAQCAPEDLLSARLGPDSVCRRLLFDTVLLEKSVLNMESSALQACVTRQELDDAILWIVSRPLMETLINRQTSRELQQALDSLQTRGKPLKTNTETRETDRETASRSADRITESEEQETVRTGQEPEPPDRESAEAALCRLCRPERGTRVVSINRSGSRAEGLDDVVIGGRSVSDHDLMLEMDFGARSKVVSRDQPSRVSLSEAPQLWVRPTDRPGFVTLHWTPTVRCEHERTASAPSAQSVRTLMWEFCQILYPTGAEFARPGPAVNFRNREHRDGGKDHVPCQRLQNWWPHQEEFQGRHRQAEFPPRVVRDDLCRFGVHLVPTGMPGSATEMIEWRVSFSRAEVVAVRLLSPVQHATITTLKSIFMLRS